MKMPEIQIGARGSTAAEFALVLPLMLILILGLIDAGRFVWTCNRAEKATQMGARFAIATDVIPKGLINYSFSVSDGIPQGGSISQDKFGGASCISTDNASAATSASCSCTGTCPDLGEADVNAFNNILRRMRDFMPELKADQVQIDYAYSGLGYAGDPNGMDVAPIVKVSLRNIGFNAGFLPGLSIDLPAFTAALTIEDGQGTVAN